MKKSEIFDILVDKVCEVCEIHREHLLDGCKVQAVVDARVLCVQYLRRIGLSCDDIALIYMRKAAGDPEFQPALHDIKKKAKGIQRQFEVYSQRCLESFSFCLLSTEIRDFCRERYRDLGISELKPLPSGN